MKIVRIRTRKINYNFPCSFASNCYVNLWNRKSFCPRKSEKKYQYAKLRTAVNRRMNPLQTLWMVKLWVFIKTRTSSTHQPYAIRHRQKFSRGFIEYIWSKSGGMKKAHIVIKLIHSSLRNRYSCTCILYARNTNKLSNVTFQYNHILFLSIPQPRNMLFYAVKCFAHQSIDECNFEKARPIRVA